MSFVFRGSRGGGDLESGFADFLPEHRNVRFQGNGRPASANPMTFFVTVLVLFMILNSHQMSPNFLLWLGMGIFLMATSLRMYALCQQLQAHAHAHAAAATAVGGLVGHTEFRLRIPPSIAFSTRGRLQGLRLQLALLDREFDDLDYDALRALDGDNPPGVASLSESEINALPLHTHKSLSHQVALVRKDSRKRMRLSTWILRKGELRSLHVAYVWNKSMMGSLSEVFLACINSMLHASTGGCDSRLLVQCVNSR